MPTFIGGRIPKVMLYMGIVGAYMKCSEEIKKDSLKVLYEECVVAPQKALDGSTCFHGPKEIR